MRRVRHIALLVAVTASLFASAAPDVRAQAGNAGSSTGEIPLNDRAESIPLHDVRIVLRNGGAAGAREDAIIARLRSDLELFSGQPFRRLEIETRLRAAQARLGSGSLTWRITEGEPGRGATLIVELDPQAAAPGGQTAFPVLYRSDRAFLTATLGGGLGAYADTNAWFGRPPLFTAGSPIAKKLPGRGSAWTEGFIEPGIGGAVQIGDAPLYAYGAVSAITSWSIGQDIFRNDTRSVTGVEKAYGGLLYIHPGNGASVNFSVGRQNFTLNDGFLVHFVRGSTNAGTRGGLYLGPRNANDLSAVADVTFGRWSLKGFYIDPNELGFLESRSTFLGGNVRYRVTPDLSVDATYIRVAESRSSFANPYALTLPREGLNTLAGHFHWRNAFALRGLWVAGELAHQTHEKYAMSAWAGYGLVGYRAYNWPWTPSLSYRLAVATGDNPNTTRYERFDALLSTGLGNWLQGVTFGKLTSNSNLIVHRLQFNVTPAPQLNLTFDWHLLRAAESNNLGSNPALGQLASRDLGQEFTASARWAISKNFFLQTVVSRAVPGSALKAIGASKPWTTYQASLYWGI